MSISMVSTYIKPAFGFHVSYSTLEEKHCILTLYILTLSSSFDYNAHIKYIQRLRVKIKSLFSFRLKICKDETVSLKLNMMLLQHLKTDTCSSEL